MTALERSVFAADVALPTTLGTDLIDDVKQVGMMKFADVGFMALRHAGDLKMAHTPGGQIGRDLAGDIALDDLAVVEVHLHLHIGLADFFDDGMRVSLPVQEKMGNVAGIDGDRKSTRLNSSH